jgi:glycosyltransferase involved in cell wall biosynthesis
MTSADPPLLSVVIPAHNEETTIAAAIESLLQQAQPGGMEIVVADGRSTDGTRTVVQRLAARDDRVRLIDNPEAEISTGMNHGIEAARGQIIMRMDAHALPRDGYVAACLESLGRTGAWNVGGRMLKRGSTSVGRAAAAATSSTFGIGGGGARFHLLGSEADVDSVWLGCWPRWVFDRIGLYDPELVVDEDEELNQRIHDAGGRIVFDPTIAAEYESRATWGSLVRQYFRYGMYKVRAIQKRPRLLRWRHFVPSALVVTLGVGAAALAASPVAAASTIVVVVAAWVILATSAARSVAPKFGADIARTELAFGAIHLAYGVGLLAGLIRFAPGWFQPRRVTP